jgi:hypothetical protein
LSCLCAFFVTLEILLFSASKPHQRAPANGLKAAGPAKLAVFHLFLMLMRFLFEMEEVVPFCLEALLELWASLTQDWEVNGVW